MFLFPRPLSHRQEFILKYFYLVSKNIVTLNEEFTEIKSWWTKRKENDNAWKVKLNDVLLEDDKGNLLNVNLDIKNPNRKSEFVYREPAELVNSIMEKEKQVMKLMKEIENEISLEVSAK